MTRHPLTQRMVRVWLSLALVATAMVYATAVARPAAAAQAVTVALSGMTPTVATSSSQELTLTGQLTVPSGESHDDVIVQLAYTEVQFRSDMSQGPGNDTPLYNVQNHLGDLTSGTYTWKLTTSLAALSASPNNVYALDVQAFSGGEPLGALRTYLPYEIGGGGDTPATTRLTVLAPVTAPSPLDGYQEPGGTYEELTEDTLAQQMGTDGSLYQLLAAGAQLPQGTISWVVDPDLLDTAAQIQDGYVVAKSGAASDAVGPDTSDAGAWLKEAKAVLHADGELWQLPSTDPDLSSLSKAPPSTAQSILATAAQQATAGGSVKNAVGTDPRGVLAWPADGEVSGPTLALAQSVDPAAVVVDSDSVGLSVPDESYTPTGRATIDGKSNVVVADSALDSIMDGDPADAAYTSDGSNATVLAAQRLLAQTALIALEEPSLGRDVMLTLPRSSATAAKDMAVLAGLKAADWLKPTGLSTLLQQQPDPKASTHTPRRSSAVTDTDLTGGQLDQVLDLDSQLQLYQSILTANDTGTSGFSGAVLRSVSTGWRGESAAWTAFTTAVSDTAAGADGPGLPDPQVRPDALRHDRFDPVHRGQPSAAGGAARPRGHHRPLRAARHPDPRTQVRHRHHHDRGQGRLDRRAGVEGAGHRLPGQLHRVALRLRSVRGQQIPAGHRHVHRIRGDAAASRVQRLFSSSL